MFGFTKSQINYIDAEISDVYSKYNSDSSPILLSYEFSMSNKGTKYQRIVWNLPSALGWFGGFLYIILLMCTSLLNPFIKDQLVFKVAKDLQYKNSNTKKSASDV